jgi:predicted branched-subunit amino acid permease
LCGKSLLSQARTALTQKQITPLTLAMPIMMGYAPIAMTFGLLTYQQHLGVWTALALSTVLYAGAAQFAILGLLALSNISLGQVFITVFLINLRHFILSLAYIPNTKQWSFFEKLRFFPILTDENFAVLLTNSEIKKDPIQAYRVSILTYSTWAVFTLIGYGFASLIPDPKILGLDFALSAMFIGIIILFIDRLEQIITFIAAILFMLFFYFVLDCGRFSVILAAILASFVGWGVECRRKSS